MKALALGATGFIGSYVVRQLVDQGHQVVVFHRGGTQVELPDSVCHILGHRRNPPHFRAAFQWVGPDVLLDVIPYIEQHAGDVITTFKGVAGRVVALSSGDVYRNYNGLWSKEHHAPTPFRSAKRHLYGRSSIHIVPLQNYGLSIRTSTTRFWLSA